jgi:hypothetical protein
VGGNANAESSRRCHRRDQILLLHIPPPIRPRSTIPRISSPSTLLRSRGWSNDDGPRHGVRSIATVLWTGVEGAMAAAVSVILPSPRTIPTAGEEARGDEVRAREEGSTTRGATEPLAAAHHRGDRADPISVCPRTLGSVRDGRLHPSTDLSGARTTTRRRSRASLSSSSSSSSWRRRRSSSWTARRHPQRRGSRRRPAVAWGAGMNRDVVRDRHRCLIGGEWGVGAGWGGTFDGKEERGGGGGDVSK